MQEKILFIINPISGTSSKSNTAQLIEEYISKEKFNIEIKFTEYAGHGSILAKEAVASNILYIVAVGGDGTVNEIAKTLINTNTALGIIPMGSGNGLARSLKIPLKVKDAILFLNKLQLSTIDSCSLNEHPFFCTAGIGFDSYISDVFDKADGRGFRTYFLATAKNYRSYQPQHYLIKDEQGKTLYKGNAFVLSLANAGQYGNNVYISPESDMKDGKMELCILESFPMQYTLAVLARLFTRKIHKSKFMNISKISYCEIQTDKKCVAHVDGEPLHLDSNTFQFKLFPNSLKVIGNP